MAILLNQMLPDALKQYGAQIFPLGLDGFLSKIIYESSAICKTGIADDESEEDIRKYEGQTGISFTIGPRFVLNIRGELAEDISTNLKAVDGLELVVGIGEIEFEADVDLEDEMFRMTLKADVLRLRFSRSLLQPVVREEIIDPNDPNDQRKISVFKVDPDKSKKIELALPSFSLSIDEKDSIEVAWPGNSPGDIYLPPAMIGDTGVVIEGKIGIDLSTTSALPDAIEDAADPAWVGLVIRDLKVFLPSDMAGILPEELTANLLIGSSGLTGSVKGRWIDISGNPLAVLKESMSGSTTKKYYDGPGSFSFFDMPAAFEA